MRCYKIRFDILSAVLSLLILSVIACDSDDKFPDPGPPKAPEEIGKAALWLTTGSQAKLLSKENDISITHITETSFPVITIDPSVKFQEVEGFGAALTGSSA